MRPAHVPDRSSATPIYDALCAEYRRLFRALPGDRSGEEDLRFEAFGGFGYRRPPAREAGRDARPEPDRRPAGGGLPALPPGRGRDTPGPDDWAQDL